MQSVEATLTMPAAWLHPLSGAARALTLRLRELDRVPDEERDDEFWERYVRVADTLARVMQALEPPVGPISKREVAERFGRPR